MIPWEKALVNKWGDIEEYLYWDMNIGFRTVIKGPNFEHNYDGVRSETYIKKRYLK